jgi:peptide/nickel transport system substrate-binding protein
VQDECGPGIVANVEALDDLTLRVRLAAPDTAFLAALAGRCGMAVSPTAVQGQGNAGFAAHPVGTGPFAFSEAKAGEHVTLNRNRSYWRLGADGRPLPYLDKLSWRIMPDGAQRVQALQGGTVDLLGGDGLPFDRIDAVKQNASLVYDQRPGLGWSGFMLNVARPPFSNKALALAVQEAIDRDAVIQNVDHGYPLRADQGVIPPPIAWAVDASYVPYRYDPGAAKAKLAEGGRPQGFSFTLLADTTDPLVQQALALYQSQLKQVGITMQTEQASFSSVVQRARSGDFEAAAIAVSGGLDPDAWIYPTFHTGGALNFPHLSDPQIDQLAEQGRAERDPAKRAGLYQQATKLIMDAGPWVMVSYRLDRFAAKKTVQGFELSRYAGSSFAAVWKASD